MEHYFHGTLSHEQQERFKPILPALIPVMGIIGRVRVLGTIQKRIGRKETTLDGEAEWFRTLREKSLSGERLVFDGIEDYIRSHITHLLTHSILQARIHIRNVDAVERVVAWLLEQKHWQFVSTWSEWTEFIWKDQNGNDVTTEVRTTPRGVVPEHHVRRSMGKTHLVFGTIPSCIKSKGEGDNATPSPTFATPGESVRTAAIARDMISTEIAHNLFQPSHERSEGMRILHNWVENAGDDDVVSPAWLSHEVHRQSLEQHASEQDTTVTVEIFAQEELLSPLPATVHPTRVAIVREKQFIQKHADGAVSDARDMTWLHTIRCEWHGNTLGEAEMRSWSKRPDVCDVRIEVRHFRFSLMNSQPRFGELQVGIPLLFAIHALHRSLRAEPCLRPLADSEDTLLSFRNAFLFRSFIEKLDRTEIRAQRMAQLVQCDTTKEKHSPQTRKTGGINNTQRLRAILRKQWGVAFSCSELTHRTKRHNPDLRVLTGNSIKKILTKKQHLDETQHTARVVNKSRAPATRSHAPAPHRKRYNLRSRTARFHG